MATLRDFTSGYRALTGLAGRVAELEAEVQECRQLNVRLAELCDVVVELLLPVSVADEQRVKELLERYRTDVRGVVGPVVDD